MPNSSLERLTAERALPERHPAPRPSPPPLSVGLGARDRTLGRADSWQQIKQLNISVSETDPLPPGTKLYMPTGYRD